MPVKPSNRTDIPSILSRRTSDDIQHEIEQIESMDFDSSEFTTEKIDRVCETFQKSQMNGE